MKLKCFMELVNARLKYCSDLLAGPKNVEYTRNDDKLWNFKQAAKLMSVSPEHALLGMWSKHLISVVEIVHDLDKGKFPSPSVLSEKITDNINYLLLLEALIVEREGELSKAKVEEVEPKKSTSGRREDGPLISADDNETKECPY